MLEKRGVASAGLLATGLNPLELNNNIDKSGTDDAYPIGKNGHGYSSIRLAN
jgi:hypothetical protein